MSLLGNMWSKIARTTSEPDAHVVIPAARVLDPPDPDAAAGFVPHASYFEIRLKQMFLRDQREYVREFTPVSSFNTEFLFAGQRVQTPLVVGPSLLANVQVDGGDHLEFINTRLLGPCPYEGDDVELFAGLFRLTTSDWAKRALSLLEALSKTFDTSKLSSTLNLAGPLTDGVEGFFGMQDLEFRLGKHTSFAAAGTGAGLQGTLQPSFLALLRMPRSKLDDDKRGKFWIREGRLAYGDSPDSLREFSECDFMLLHIAPLASRSDFSSFEFHQKHWRKIDELLAEQKIDDAEDTFRLLAANLAQCSDIVRTHRMALLRQYRRWIDDSIEEYERLFGRPGRAPDRMRSGGGGRSSSSHNERLTTRGTKRSDSDAAPRSGPIGEADLAAAISQAVDTSISPERMFASVTGGTRRR